MKSLRLTLLGVGAMNSPRYAPAGLLVECGATRVMIDGGPGAEPKPKVAVWLVTDQRGELIREIRKLARPRGLEPIVSDYSSKPVSIEPHNVVHTFHVTYGYVIASTIKRSSGHRNSCCFRLGPREHTSCLPKLPDGAAQFFSRRSWWSCLS